MAKYFLETKLKAVHDGFTLDTIKRINDIYSGIQEILSRLDGMSASQSVCSEMDKGDRDKEGEGERILRESVMELINM